MAGEYAIPLHELGLSSDPRRSIEGKNNDGQSRKEIIEPPMSRRSKKKCLDLDIDRNLLISLADMFI